MADRLNSTARVNDGWRYVVLLRGGSRVEVWDHDGLDAVTARWASAKPGAVLAFSGAALEPNTPSETAGAVRSDEVLAIREYSAYVDDEGRDSFMGAHAVLEETKLVAVRQQFGLPDPDEDAAEGEPEDAPEGARAPSDLADLASLR